MTIELPIKLKQRMAKGKFVIVGRAGMDLYPKPANKQTSEAGTLSLIWGDLLQTLLFLFPNSEVVLKL